MSLPVRKMDIAETPAAPAAAVTGRVQAPVTAVVEGLDLGAIPDSPARLMQQRLNEAYGETREQKSWPGAAKLAFLLGSSAALWLIIIQAARAILG